MDLFNKKKLKQQQRRIDALQEQLFIYQNSQKMLQTQRKANDQWKYWQDRDGHKLHPLYAKSLNQSSIDTIIENGHKGIYKTRSVVLGYKAVQKGIAEVYIPRGAIIVKSGRKCRTNALFVKSITEPTTNEKFEESEGWFSSDFIYTAEEIAVAESPLDTNMQEECKSGLHFFKHHNEALVWYNRIN